MKWFSKERKLARALRATAARQRDLWLDADLLRYLDVAQARLAQAENADALASRLERGLVTYEYAVSVLRTIAREDVTK